MVQLGKSNPLRRLGLAIAAIWLIVLIAALGAVIFREVDGETVRSIASENIALVNSNNELNEALDETLKDLANVTNDLALKKSEYALLEDRIAEIQLRDSIYGSPGQGPFERSHAVVDAGIPRCHHQIDQGRFFSNICSTSDPWRPSYQSYLDQTPGWPAGAFRIHSWIGLAPLPGPTLVPTNGSQQLSNPMLLRAAVSHIGQSSYRMARAMFSGRFR